MIEMPDRLLEIGYGDAVLVIENSTAKDIEKNVRVMMGGDILLRGDLKAVRRSDDPRELVCTVLNRCSDVAFEFTRIR